MKGEHCVAARVSVVGGTGRYGAPVVAAMLRRGFDVRVISRRPGPAPAGARTVAVDLHRRESVVRALEGSTHVYVNPPPTLRPDEPWVFEREGIDCILAAMPPGAGLIKLSEIDADRHGPFDDLRFKYESERRIASSGRDFLILRPTWFMEALVDQLRVGRWVLATNLHNPVFWLHTRDLGEQVCEAVENWHAVRGQTLTLQGPQALSVHDAVEAWNEAGGRNLRAVRVPLGLLELGGRVHAQTRFVAQLMRFYGSRSERFQASQSWRLLGPATTTFAQAVARHGSREHSTQASLTQA